MKTYAFLLALLTISISSGAQQFPQLTGETIENKNLTFPSDLKGKFSLLCLASSQKAEPDLQTWLDPIYQKFIAKTGLMDDMYEVNVYFIPILTGTNLAFATSMKNKFKESAQEDLRPHVLFSDKDGKEILEKLNMNSKEIPYLFLLNKEGQIVYRTNGKFTDEKFDAIDELVSE